MHFLVFLWIPSYFNQNYGVDIKQSAVLSIFPWCCAIVATLCTGAVADALNNREVLSLTHVRKLMQGIGSFGPAGCLFYLAWLDTVSLRDQCRWPRQAAPAQNPPGMQPAVSAHQCSCMAIAAALLVLK